MNMRVLIIRWIDKHILEDQWKPALLCVWIISIRHLSRPEESNASQFQVIFIFPLSIALYSSVICNALHCIVMCMYTHTWQCNACACAWLRIFIRAKWQRKMTVEGEKERRWYFNTTIDQTRLKRGLNLRAHVSCNNRDRFRTPAVSERRFYEAHLWPCSGNSTWYQIHSSPHRRKAIFAFSTRAFSFYRRDFAFRCYGAAHLYTGCTVTKFRCYSILEILPKFYSLEEGKRNRYIHLLLNLFKNLIWAAILQGILYCEIVEGRSILI